ncbi:hypothetical protein ACP8H2_09805 [Bacillus subtilis]
MVNKNDEVLYEGRVYRVVSIDNSKKIAIKRFLEEISVSQDKIVLL